MSVMVLFALMGGILPALLWLTFWLLEDRCQPEPKRYIFISFVLGMLMVPLVLPVEKYAMLYFPLGSLPLLICWAFAEEMGKYIAAYIGGLRSAAFDEPLDAVIYLVTAALGFSALENALFIWGPLSQNDAIYAIVAGDLRFVGASLLHILASATIGITMALSWGRPAAQRRLAALGGVILAVALHTLFNFFILNNGSDATFWVFLVIWVGIIGLLVAIERIKQPAKDYC